jgi:MYXO-CTERM domain-containing protein
MVTRSLAPLVVAVALATPAVAHAAAPDAGESIADLEAEIDRNAAVVERARQSALAQAQADCDTACRAFDSMRRASDRLCALDPGDRCTAARGKVRDAADKLRAACPACAAPQQQLAQPSSLPPPAPPPAGPAYGATRAEEAEATSKRGGCAGCATAPADHAELALGALGIAAIALLARRRR